MTTAISQLDINDYQLNIEMSAGQIFYTDIVDIFFFKVDICQLGNDQIRVNVLTQEYCDQ